MPTRAEVLTALLGALKLARFDTDGARFFGNTSHAAWQSFFAAILAAPFYLFLVVAHGFGADEGTHAVMAMIFSLLSYAGGWLFFPVIVWFVVRAMDREDRFAHFLAAYNWSAVIHNALFFLLALIDAVIGTSTGARGLFTLLILVYVALYIWFVARTTLEIRSGQAAMIVGVDVLSAVVWAGFGDRLVNGS